MQSKTSFFNQTVFLNDLRHWWPLTAGYTLLWLLILPFSCFTELSHRATLRPDGILHEALSITAVGGYWSALFAGVLFAMAAFAYLANPRATNGLHALPARRETLYVTHCLAGLCSQLAPQLLAVLLTAAVLAPHGATDARVFGLMFLSLALPTFFFYSFGVLCMIFTGQILAAPVFYFVLNFLAVGMEALIRSFAGNFLYGWAGNGTLALGPLSPMYWMVSYPVRANFQPVMAGGEIVRDAAGVVETKLTVVGLHGLWLYAAAGIALAALGLLVYRKRHSEATGTTVAIYWARPIFKYGVAFCGAMALGQLFYELFFGQYQRSGNYSLPGMIACMAAAGLLAYFLAEMLLKKSFRVWKSGWKGAVAVTAVLIALGVGMTFDFTGYEGYVPDPAQIDAANFSLVASGGDARVELTTRDAETLRLLTDAHRAVAKDKRRQLGNHYEKLADVNDYTAEVAYFRVSYTLRGGHTVTRRYDVTLYGGDAHTDATPTAALTALYNTPEARLQRALGSRDWSYMLTDPAAFADLRLSGGSVSMDVYDENGYARSDSRDLTAAEAQAVYDAIRRDVDAGRIDESLFGSVPSMQGGIELWASYTYAAPETTSPVYYGEERNGRQMLSFDPRVTESMTETVETLRSMGIDVRFFG